MHRLMFVDDEQNVLSSLQRLCRNKKEWEIEVYSDPQLALKRLQTKTFSLVLSDYRMPEIDGVQFLIVVKKLQPDTMRLILSGQTDRGGLLNAINEAEIFRFFDKPWKDGDLLTGIRQALQYHEIMQENLFLANQVREQQQELLKRQQVLQSYKILHPDLFKVDWASDGSIIVDDDPNQAQCS